jgi:hypothetical protein
MRVLLSATFLGFACFAAINVAVSAIAWLAARRVNRDGRTANPGVLLLVRLLPALASGVFVVAFFVPTHVRFEQAESDERFGLGLAVLAAVGFGLACRSAYRLICVWRNGQRFERALKPANRLADDTFEIDGMTGVSLAGILRPQILIGSDVLATLTPAELDVAISHEVAHRRSRDNFKRLLIFCAPDVFGWSDAARRLEDRWQAETECEADARAVMGDETRALVLASALVKVAQLTRRAYAPRPAEAWSTFHIQSVLETRIRRLASDRVAVPARQHAWLTGTIAAMVMLAGAWALGLSYPLHQVTEALVTHLP